jgi:hypothetical protein
MTHAPSSYARRARVIHLRAFLSLAAALAIPLAACGDRPQGAGKDAAADTANADTSALGVAREHLGPEVRQAIPFTVANKDGRFIAAALPVQEWVNDPLREGVSVAPGGHEIVLLEMPDTAVTYAINKPGLYVTDLPGTPRTGPNAPAEPDSNALRHLSGVDDTNGDGDPEVWSVQYGGPRHPYTWEIRAYDRGGRALYQLAARRRRGGTGVDPESWDPSRNLQGQPAIRAWMEQKVNALETQFAAADTTAAGSGR